MSLLASTLDAVEYTRKAYDDLDEGTRRQYLRLLLPITLLAEFVVLFLLFTILPDLFGSRWGQLALGVVLLVFTSLSFFLYPVVAFQARKTLIDREMLFFMIRMGILAEAGMAKKDMFDMRSEMEDFQKEGLAREVGKIYKLVETWNVNLGDACRIVSKRTPSKLFSDFLDRLSHTIDTGGEPEEFFKREQKAFKNNYEVEYRGTLFKLEILMELFIAIVIIATFFEFFVVIMPFLNYSDSTLFFIGVPFLFIFLELVYLFFLQASMPREQLRHGTGLLSESERGELAGLGLAVVLTIAFTGLAFLFLRDWFLDDTLMPLLAAMITTPLALAGLQASSNDRAIIRIEDSYPAFIRSLGGSASSGGTGTLQALEKLKTHDFGPLTEHIKALFKRIKLNIDGERSWDHFGAETGSDLVAKFSKMYMKGVKAGGNHEGVSEVVSKNFLDVMGLRRHRYIYASIFTMVIYGIALVVSFSLFIAGDVTKEVAEKYTGFEIPGAIGEAGIQKPEVYDDYVLTLAFFVILLSHAIISGFIIRVVGSGSMQGVLVHVSGILWVGALMSIFSEFIISRIL